MRKSILLAVMYFISVFMLLGVSILLITTVKSIPDLFAILEFNGLVFYLISWGYYSIITDTYDKELRMKNGKKER